jgi:hypothetical protein
MSHRPGDLYRAKRDVTGDHTVDLGNQGYSQSLLFSQFFKESRFLIGREGGFKDIADCRDVVRMLWDSDGVGAAIYTSPGSATYEPS